MGLSRKSEIDYWAAVQVGYDLLSQSEKVFYFQRNVSCFSTGCATLNPIQL